MTISGASEKLSRIALHLLPRYVGIIQPSRIYLFFSDAKQALIPSSLARQALDRDNRCIFSGVSSTGSFAVTWIFPFEGFTVKVLYFITTEQPFFDCRFLLR